MPTPGEIRVEAELSSPSRSWSFRNAYAGVLGIAERVGDFRAIGAAGKDAQAKKSAAGEFRSELDATKIAYTVKLAEPRATDVPYVSWLADDRGLLMFADLIPQDIETLSAEFKLPTGWTLESSLVADASGRYTVSESHKAVFLTGRTLGKASNTIDGVALDVVLSGKWPFKEAEVLNVANTVLQKYIDLTGFKLPNKATIMVTPFPTDAGNSEWKAETRGSTVVLLGNPKKFDVWRNRLRVIFSHELLHLWVPNSLNLEGDYDWFFEGFTLYTALRTAQELGGIDFKETLNTLGRVYDVYLSHPDEQSLIEASETRWTNPGSQVSIKAMLVAFLYDLKIRKESGGKLTLGDRYRELFSRRVTANANGNEVIIAVLDSVPAMSGFVKQYVESSTKLELEQMLPAYGLTLDSSGKKSQLSVSRDLNPEQQQLLRSLGYRN
jgi:predicted metalloprotease with PDZ domain